MLKRFFKTDYHGIVAILSDWPSLCEDMGLVKTPHFTILQKAEHRLLRDSRVKALLGQTGMLLYGGEPSPPREDGPFAAYAIDRAATDSTGLETDRACQRADPGQTVPDRGAQTTHQINNEDIIGQGPWPTDDGEGVLLINGNEVVCWLEGAGAGKPLRVEQSPLVGRRIADLQGGEKWQDTEDFIERVNAMDADRCAATWSRLMDALGGWRFRRPGTRELLAGMIVLTCVQALLPFSPQCG